MSDFDEAYIHYMLIDVINSFISYPSHRVCLPTASLPICKYGCCNVKMKELFNPDALQKSHNLRFTIERIGYITIYAHQSRQSNIFHSIFINSFSYTRRTKNFIWKRKNKKQKTLIKAWNHKKLSYIIQTTKTKKKAAIKLPKMKEAGWAARSWGGGLKTIVWSSTQSQAIWSLANCSFLFKGLNLTVTTIFSSFALGPPGVVAGVLSILEAGVPGVLSVIFFGQNLLFPFTIHSQETRKWKSPASASLTGETNKKLGPLCLGCRICLYK